jgi:hypothetical protein
MTIQQISFNRRTLLKGALASAGALCARTPAPAHAGWPASSFSPYLFNSGVPTGMHNATIAAINQWIAAVTFTPSGEWLVVSGTGVIHKSSGFPTDCWNQIGSYIAAGNRINCVAFRPLGGRLRRSPALHRTGERPSVFRLTNYESTTPAMVNIANQYITRFGL